MDDRQANVRDDAENHQDNRVSADAAYGDELMTTTQAFYLKALSQQAREPSAYNERLTRAQASKQIERLEQKIGLSELDE